MKLFLLTLTTAAFILIAPTVFAQGVSNDAPGHQPKGAHNSTGATYNAPGQEMRRDAPTLNRQAGIAVVLPALDANARDCSNPA